MFTHEAFVTLFLPCEEEKGQNTRASDLGRELRSGHGHATPGSRDTITSFHLSAQLAPFLTELPAASCLPPATMNGYQSEPGCFDTKHQCHSPGVFIDKSIILARYKTGVSFSHQNGNFHSFCLSFIQEGKTKRGRREGARFKLLESTACVFPWDSPREVSLS